jgi:16S rRNA C967 or C1407 C5-methylase (RsmB/RsmF family)
MIASFRLPLGHAFRAVSSSPEFRGSLACHFSRLRDLGVPFNHIASLDSRFGDIYRLSINRSGLMHRPELSEFRNWLSHHSEFGDLVRQEFVSMIPPFFLDVQPNSRVLDCCAAPGSKTSQILIGLASSEGLLVANDVNPNRCRTLVHTLNRYDIANCVVVSFPAQYLCPLGPFDRILCDVPCSSDGTLRKSPDAGMQFAVENGESLHPVQRAILIRCLQLLSVGGRLVYSTCSLNPIENEAVVNSVLLECAGSVRIVDCHGVFPGLVHSWGLREWKVLSKEFVEVPQSQKNATLFCEPKVENLEFCMRFFPHQNNSGGFFLAVLEKTGEVDLQIPKLAHRPLSKWREPPFRPITSLSTEIAAKIISDFGMPQDFDLGLLFVHDESVVNNVYLMNRQVADMLGAVPPDQLRAVACGIRIFTWKTLTGEAAVCAIPCIEGIQIVNRLVTKRRVVLEAADVRRLIVANNDGIALSELAYGEALMGEPPGGFLFCVRGSELCYGGMRIGDKLKLYLRKQLADSELRRIADYFPDLREPQTVLTL